MLATFFHTSRVFENETFVTDLCKSTEVTADIKKSVGIFMKNDKQKLLLYTELWRAFF